jgi:hypothetical protein
MRPREGYVNQINDKDEVIKMRASVQIIGLVSMLILGIFLGIDSAEKNMQKMQGIEGVSRAFQITPVDGKIEISVLGQTVETKNLVPNIVQEPVREVKETIQPESVQPEPGQPESGRLATFNNGVGVHFRDTMRKVAEILLSWAK